MSEASAWSRFWKRARRSFLVDPVSDLKPWAERHQRSAHFPRVREGQGEPRGSRFNGLPFLIEGEDWPACQVCAKPMPLFLQLNLGAAPGEYAERFGAGLLQLFYCVDECESAGGDAWEPFAHLSKLARVVPEGAAGAVAAARETGLPAVAQTIVGWDAKPDRFNVEEAAEHGLERQSQRLPGGLHKTRFVCAATGIDTGWIDHTAVEGRVYLQVFSPAPGDKLGGWPYWVQGVEYPNCARCGARMQLVFQIDSEQHVPFMFGDLGVGHVTQCPAHKDVVTFGWACH